MEPVHYKSSDGLEIPAYLTLPKGIPAKNLPLLSSLTAAPGAAIWGYNRYTQFFANRGYAVLSPTSVLHGYGKKFLNAATEWGKKMQDDLPGA